MSHYFHFLCSTFKNVPLEYWQSGVSHIALLVILRRNTIYFLCLRSLLDVPYVIKKVWNPYNTPNINNPLSSQNRSKRCQVWTLDKITIQANPHNFTRDINTQKAATFHQQNSSKHDKKIFIIAFFSHTNLLSASIVVTHTFIPRSITEFRSIKTKQARVSEKKSENDAVGDLMCYNNKVQFCNSMVRCGGGEIFQVVMWVLYICMCWGLAELVFLLESC